MEQGEIRNIIRPQTFKCNFKKTIYSILKGTRSTYVQPLPTNFVRDYRILKGTCSMYLLA